MVNLKRLGVYDGYSTMHCITYGGVIGERVSEDKSVAIK
jgi:hypothetical protein